MYVYYSNILCLSHALIYKMNCCKLRIEGEKSLIIIERDKMVLFCVGLIT